MRQRTKVVRRNQRRPQSPRKRLPLPPLMRAIPQDQVSKRRIVMPSGVPTRRRAVPMVGMIISNSWPNACEYDAPIGRTGCQMIDAKRGSSDRRTVAAGKAHEVAYFAKKHGLSKEQTLS